VFPPKSSHGLPRMKLTAKTVAALQLPEGRSEAIHFDNDVAGFGLRLRAGGGRTWVYQYKLGDKHRRITLGSATAIDVATARAQAVTLYAQVKLGQDPAGKKAEGRERAMQTFGAIVNSFLRAQQKRLRPRSYIDTERYMLHHFKLFHGLPIGSINRQAIAIRLGEIAASAPTAADMARSSLSAFFSWAMREGLTDANPATGLNKFADTRPRDRVLSDDELADVWRALGSDGEYGAIVRLLILTGLRREEIGGLGWSEVDAANAVLRLPATRTKNSRPHDVQLSDMALAIIEARPKRLDRDFIFGLSGQRGYNSWGHDKAQLDKRIRGARRAAKAKPWRLHDLRRTVATRLGDLGVQPHIVEACLNHQSGAKRGVAGTYNKSPYERETRTAMALWADHVRSIIEESPRKVLPMRA
jgi:integrase